MGRCIDILSARQGRIIAEHRYFRYTISRYEKENGTNTQFRLPDEQAGHFAGYGGFEAGRF